MAEKNLQMAEKNLRFKRNFGCRPRGEISHRGLSAPHLDQIFYRLDHLDHLDQILDHLHHENFHDFDHDDHENEPVTEVGEETELAFQSSKLRYPPPAFPPHCHYHENCGIKDQEIWVQVEMDGMGWMRYRVPLRC